MTSRPILFSAPMVRAILSGAKTQTRRILKQPRRTDGAKLLPELLQRIGVGHACPHGAVGDQLYVKERCWIWGRWTRNGLTAKGRQKWRFRASGKRQVVYEAPDAVAPRRAPDGQDGPEGWVLRIPRFMPRWASRITLEVTGVRVERLHGITEEDAIAEGCPGTRGGRHPAGDDGQAPSEEFRDLWRDINGAESWDANPWVWVVEFKRVAP